MFTKYLPALLLILIFFAWGCPEKSNDLLERYNKNPTIHQADDMLVESKDKIEKDAEEITKDAENIGRETEKINSKLDDQSKPELTPFLVRIKDASNNIIENADNILSEKVNLDKAHLKLQESKKQIRKIDNEAAKAVEAKKKAEKELEETLKREAEATRKMIRWLIIICVIGGGVGIALLAFGHIYIGGAIAIGSATTGTLAITVNAYIDYIAYAGLAMIVIGIGIFAWQFFRRERALEETIETTEVAKEKLTPKERRKLFGYGAQKGDVYNLQSRSTENLIARKRKKLKKMWEHTVLSASSQEMDKQEEDNKRQT